MAVDLTFRDVSHFEAQVLLDMHELMQAVLDEYLMLLGSTDSSLAYLMDCFFSVLPRQGEDVGYWETRKQALRLLTMIDAAQEHAGEEGP